MKKILIVSSVASMIQQFNLDNISVLQRLGYEVSVATNFLYPGTITLEDSKDLRVRLENKGVITHQIDFARGLGTFNSNKTAITQLRKLKQKNYDLLHCHSPIGGILSRYVFKNSKTKIIYTAHGFHFYKGGSLIDWLIFYPIEKYFSKFTDLILTINKDDTEIAKNHFHCPVKMIPGVGIDYQRIQNSLYISNSNSSLYTELSIPKSSIILISVGEINDNKNHIAGIEALHRLHNSKIHYVICGIGKLENILKSKVEKLGLQENVHFIGYVHDIERYLVSADIFLFLSKREGLGLAGLEAMAAGLPLVSSYIGGIKDYTVDGITGFTINNPNDYDSIAKSIDSIINLSDDDKRKISDNNQEIASSYSKEKVNKAMNLIYSSFG